MRAWIARAWHAAAVSAPARSEDGDDTPRLVAVHAIFRHGARTPVYADVPGLERVTWPACSAASARDFSLALDPGEPALRVRDVVVAPCPVRLHHLLDTSRPPPRAPVEIVGQWATVLGGGCRGGQLTAVGCAQAHELGARLRAAYGNGRLVADVWDERAMSVRSTCVPRCVASAQYVLRGLFPRQVEPVPVGVGEFGEETLFPNGRRSERLAHILADGRASWERSPPEEAVRVRELVRRTMPADAFRAYGMDRCNFVRMRDVLVALDVHALPLPHGLGDGGVLERVDALATEQIVRMMRGGGGPGGTGADLSHEAHRHSLGVFVSQLLAQMDERVRGENTTALRLYSAHDTTLLPLLMILGAFEPPHNRWPGFCSCLALELHDLVPGAARPVGEKRRGEEEFGVRVMYNFEDITARVPGCPRFGPCPLPAFREAVRLSLLGADGHTVHDPHGGSRDPMLVGGGMSQF